MSSLAQILRPTYSQMEMVRRLSDTTVRVDLGPEFDDDGRTCSLCGGARHNARSCLKGSARPKRLIRIVTVEEVIGHLQEPWAFAYVRLCLGVIVGHEEADRAVGDARWQGGRWQ